jgi:hypothetical protein
LDHRVFKDPPVKMGYKAHLVKKAIKEIREIREVLEILDSQVLEEILAVPGEQDLQGAQEKLVRPVHMGIPEKPVIPDILAILVAQGLAE